MRYERTFMLARAEARDKKYDGKFITGVTSTGIYCLPSCPARKPKAENVIFFSHEDEARAANLRPCRRCRPDDFYRNYDPDLDLAEALAQRMRENPAAIDDGAGLQRLAGVGQTKLNQLFRDYFQTTPVRYLRQLKTRRACELLRNSKINVGDVAGEVGFESQSSFHDHFRKATGLSPGAYRDMGSEFNLTEPPGYQMEDSLAYAGRDPEGTSERVAPQQMILALSMGEESGRVLVTKKQGVLRVEILEPRPCSPAFVEAAWLRALRFLGLTVDPQPFEKLLQRKPRLSHLAHGIEGTRLPLSGNIFEGLMWAIIGQQVNLTFAMTMRRALIRTAGRPLPDDMFTHPTPEEVARLDYADLTAQKYSRRKAEYVIDTARAIAAGDLDPEQMQHLSARRVEETLCQMRGIGLWTARYVMLRGCGFEDSLPLGDAGLRNGLIRFFDLQHKPDNAEVEHLMKVFAPYRSLATCYLWKRLNL